MPSWWGVGAPYLEAASIVLALLLGAGNLTWLVVQARRARVTHALALEAHRWARERRDHELAKEQDAGAMRTWLAETKRTVDASREPCEIPEDVNPTWIVEGEQHGYFRRIRHPSGRSLLTKA